MQPLINKIEESTPFQNFAKAFKEVKNDTNAVKWSLKGIFGVIYAAGLTIALGPSAIAVASLAKTANRIIWFFQSTGEISVWANYKYKGAFQLVKDCGNTLSYIPVYPHLIKEFKIADITMPKPLGIGFDGLDIFLCICSAGTSIAFLRDANNGTAHNDYQKKIDLWKGRIVEIKSGNYSTAETKKLRVTKIDTEEMKAALLSYACQKKMKWEAKDERVGISFKSKIYSLAFAVSMSTLLTFSIISAVTAAPAAAIGATVSLPICAFFKIYGFLYDAFNPAPSAVAFKVLKA